MKLRRTLIVSIVNIVFALVIIYFFTPVLNFRFYGFPFLVLLISGINTLLILYLDNRVSIIAAPLLALSLLFFLILPFFSTASIFRSSRYHSQIGTVNSARFADVIEPIDISKIRLVDQNMAEKLGDKKIGEDPALGSVAKPGTFSIQKFNGELYWVAPLVHSSFFKWLNNREGSDGYLMVSATNPQDVRLVQNIDTPIKIKYQPDAFFGDKLSRHIYLNGYLSAGFTDFTFEINEEGRPFWVVSKYEKTIGYSGKEVTGTIIVNAQTGEISEYSIDDTPKWIDRIQPESFVKEQVNNWGKFERGWMNSVFSQEGVLQLTAGISLVYGKDGESYWYSGLTSAGADESTVGFILVNTRNKQINFYKQPGATEVSAMSSAEGKVQEKGYNSTFPIMYNVYGIPTYISSLKDKAGLIKLIAMISVEDYSIIGIGETTAEALRSYKNSLSKSLKSDDLESNLVTKKTEGYIERIRTDIQSGNSYYYIKLYDDDNLYVGNSNISQYLVISEENDYIQIEYDDAESNIIDISSFKNLNLND